MMQQYGVLRRGGWRSHADLTAALERAAYIACEQMPDDVRWLRSYILDEDRGEAGTVCIYQAISPEAIRRHAAYSGLPVDEIIAIAGTMLGTQGPPHDGPISSGRGRQRETPS